MRELSDDPAPSWDHPRTAVAVRLMVEVAEEYGLEAADCLAGTGLRASELTELTTTVEAAQELAVARNLLGALGDLPGLGLDVGLRYRYSSFGIWGFALLTSATPRELISLGVRYSPLSFAFITPLIEENDRELRVVLAADAIPPDVRDFFVERELAKLANLLPVGLGELATIGFETEFTGDRASALLSRFPKLDLRFDAPRHCLVVDRASLDLPLPEADPVTAQELEELCARMLESRRSRRGIAGSVRERIVADLPSAPRMVDAARALHLDERTLRRKLADEGTSYRELLDEVRQTLAEDLLRHATVAETARRLGYHDAAGFVRAHKRWMGLTPREAGDLLKPVVGLSAGRTS